jgi:hypothetical protein
VVWCWRRLTVAHEQPSALSRRTGRLADPRGQDSLVKGRVTVDQHRQSDLVKQRDDPGMRLADSQSAAGPFEPEVMSQ